jgi:hypothetical protein
VGRRGLYSRHNGYRRRRGVRNRRLRRSGRHTCGPGEPINSLLPACVAPSQLKSPKCDHDLKDQQGDRKRDPRGRVAFDAADAAESAPRCCCGQHVWWRFRLLSCADGYPGPAVPSPISIAGNR